MSDDPAACPMCEMPDGTVLSTHPFQPLPNKPPMGQKRYYRCKACLWSWSNLVPLDAGEGD